MEWNVEIAVTSTSVGSFLVLRSPENSFWQTAAAQQSGHCVAKCVAKYAAIIPQCFALFLRTVTGKLNVGEYSFYFQASPSDFVILHWHCLLFLPALRIIFLKPKTIVVSPCNDFKVADKFTNKQDEDSSFIQSIASRLWSITLAIFKKKKPEKKQKRRRRSFGNQATVDIWVASCQQVVIIK